MDENAMLPNGIIKYLCASSKGICLKMQNPVEGVSAASWELRRQGRYDEA
jgi:hypothetical protein